MIYTTYFGKLNSRDFDKAKFTPIAICAKPPGCICRQVF